MKNCGSSWELYRWNNREFSNLPQVTMGRWPGHFLVAECYPTVGVRRASPETWFQVSVLYNSVCCAYVYFLQCYFMSWSLRAQPCRRLSSSWATLPYCCSRSVLASCLWLWVPPTSPHQHLKIRKTRMWFSKFIAVYKKSMQKVPECYECYT